MVAVGCWRFSMLLLWLFPITILVYSIGANAIPACMHGLPVCPPHTGPAVAIIGMASTALFLTGFIFVRACFLFPCLCAPEARPRMARSPSRPPHSLPWRQHASPSPPPPQQVPGWLFFPPASVPVSPITDGDVDTFGVALLLDKLFGKSAFPSDCVWEPPTCGGGDCGTWSESPGSAAAASDLPWCEDVYDRRTDNRCKPLPGHGTNGWT